MRKQGLANHPTSLVGAGDKREVTPGITESSPARVHIDPEVCYFDVVCSYPGGAAAAKGGAVRPLKGILRWVHYVARQ
jgi:hypothetical protein